MEKKPVNEKIDVDFESHPPIDEDLDGVTSLLRQSLLNFVDCHQLATYLIGLKDITQIIAQAAPEEDEASEDDEPDDDIYGVVSVIDLLHLSSNTAGARSSQESDKDKQCSAVREQLAKFLEKKCPTLKDHLTQQAKEGGEVSRYGMIVNERFINLPPQLALPTFRSLSDHLKEKGFQKLILVAKILIKSRSSDTSLPSKKAKSSSTSEKHQSADGTSRQDDAVVYVNPEEEILFENCEHHTDIDVSSYCDENATWSFSSDVKYIPYRRIMLIDCNKWPTILKALEDEFK